MKTTSLKKLLNHNFFIYGMVFISVLQLLNFYNAYSLLCLGTFGLTYYIACMATKNKGVCLLTANIVSIFILGCEKSGVLEGFKEGVDPEKEKKIETPAASMESRLKILEDAMDAHGAGTDAVKKPHKEDAPADAKPAQ